MYKILLSICWLTYAGVLHAQQWNFTLHKHVSGVPGPTLLVIGGIQGDEPGGFNAASLLVTDYKINRGQVWVVPNLNFESIIKRSRGVHGDMNRKFKNIRQTDPEFELVQKIKSIITDDSVDIILNLHDGSGFYRPYYIDRLHNRNRWGQSIIIDQASIDVTKYGDLAGIARQISSRVNERVRRGDYNYFVKNTHTRLGNKEMEKTLTYYAIQRGKSAFGVEASKEFNTHKRAYSHLQVIESFLDYLGMEYERKFELTEASVKNRIDTNIKLILYESKIMFDMVNARKRLGYIPMIKGKPVNYIASNPLIAILDKKKHFKVHYGNRSVTTLLPEYLAFDDSLSDINMLLDGKQRRIELGDVVLVNKSFQVLPLKDYRINVIGFTRKGVRNEQGLTIRKKDILKRFSVDRSGKLFRVEVYKDRDFCGMVLVRFADTPVAVTNMNHTDS